MIRLRFAYWLQCVGVLLLTALAGMSAVTVVIASPKDLTIQAAVQIPQLVPSVNMSLIGRGLETSVVVNPTNPSNMIVTGVSRVRESHAYLRMVDDHGVSRTRHSPTSTLS